MIQIYGVSSSSRDGRRHLLFLDIDSPANTAMVEVVNRLYILGLQKYQHSIVRTPHGWHIIVWHHFTFDQCRKIMSEIPHLDLKWFTLGIQRGYWFLWTREPIYAPLGFKLKYMRLSIDVDQIPDSIKKVALRWTSKKGLT